MPSFGVVLPRWQQRLASNKPLNTPIVLFQNGLFERKTLALIFFL
jgi:hypothetical protein